MTKPRSASRPQYHPDPKASPPHESYQFPKVSDLSYEERLVWLSRAIFAWWRLGEQVTITAWNQREYKYFVETTHGPAVIPISHIQVPRLVSRDFERGFDIGLNPNLLKSENLNYWHVVLLREILKIVRVEAEPIPRVPRPRRKRKVR